MNLIINKKELEKDEWKFLQNLYPNTMIEIIDWYFSNKKNIKNFPYTIEDLSNEIQYFDRWLYDYFDSVKIHISVFKKDKKFTSYVNKSCVGLNNIYSFKERSFADICGFIHGMHIRESFLNKSTLVPINAHITLANTQRNAIENPLEGMTIIDSESFKKMTYNGYEWIFG